MHFSKHNLYHFLLLLIVYTRYANIGSPKHARHRRTLLPPSRNRYSSIFVYLPWNPLQPHFSSSMFPSRLKKRMH
ncbi:hypothetical protein BKA65DRAFT_129304 [Rhexocercosporidium sp. MPI-PUGE-AT-0058]|nr:hypothetical protein BKA65DRAFT_129304 [Rhexocercosporidium sp. MPI-PUGE-AT-0058]